MNDADKWAAFDTAKFSLDIMIGHYSELVFNETKKEMPDLSKIAEWEAAQDSLVQEAQALTVDNEADVRRINSAYVEPVRAVLKAE